VPTEIKQGGQGKDKKKTSKTLRRVLLQGSVDRELKALHKTGKSNKGSSPGVKARAKNLRRTGQAVPVTVKGKPTRRPGPHGMADKSRKKNALKGKGPT